MLTTTLKTKRRAILTLAMIALSAALILGYLFYRRAAAAPQGILITIERTACFGTCPAYRLEIDGDGKVVYEGHEFVEVKGTRMAYISERKVRELAAEFEQIDFYQLDDHYAIGATDLPSVIVSINFEGKTKTVDIYGGGAPKKLSDLIQQIEATVNVARWVGQ